MDPLQTKDTPAIPAAALATLTEIAQDFSSSLSLDNVLARAAHLIRRILDFEIFAVMLIDERDQHLSFRFAIGHRQEVVDNWRIPVGQGITGRAAALKQPVRVSDVRQDANYINAVDSVRSELAVPLMVKGSCIGVLDIQSSQLDYFTPEQQNVLTLLASRLAIAIENARLFERTVHQTDTLLLLHELVRDAGAILDVEAQLRRVAELAKRVIDYQIFSILLYDDKEHAFRHRITVKFGEKIQEKYAVPATEGIVGAAATSRQPVIVPDVTADPRYLSVNPETRSELAIPMLHKGRVIGVMDLESPQLNYFTGEHVQTLSILAGHLAVSLENARLYEQVARDESRMERELQAARRIQAGLLPAPPAEDAGLEIAARYISARELGGDVYDFVRYGPQQLGIALGDVSGKGTAAALYGAAAIGTLRSLTLQKMQPAALLRQFNQLIGERKIDERFMTLCFATWHRGRRRLRIANAGQTQPFLWKSGRCEKVKLEGVPLGILEDVTYSEWSTTLEPGDMIVFYSDGVTETVNPRGEFYGAQRLAQFVESHALEHPSRFADLLMEDLERFAEGAAPYDDRTLVVVRVKGDSI